MDSRGELILLSLDDLVGLLNGSQGSDCRPRDKVATWQHNFVGHGGANIDCWPQPPAEVHLVVGIIDGRLVKHYPLVPFELAEVRIEVLQRSSCLG